MTQKQCAEAYKALTEITAEKWPISDAYKLYQAKQALKSAWDFQIERETALLQAYGAKPEGDRLNFPDVESRVKFEAEIAELNAMDAGVTVAKIRLRAPDGMTILPDTLGALDGIVEFIEG